MKSRVCQPLVVLLAVTAVACGGDDDRNNKKPEAGDISDADDDDDDDDDDDGGADGGSRLDVGENPTEPSNSENGDEEESGCNHVDFLFVVDNSRSMLDEQQNLANSVPGFIERIHSFLELQTFNLGIVTSDAYAHSLAPCNQLGGLVTNTPNGNCGPYDDGHNFMTEDDDLDETFVCAARLGNEGESDERPMEAMVNAIGTGLGAEGGCNEGFVRDKALLVVVAVTDEEDDQDETPGWGSVGQPTDWYDAVVQAKDGKPENAVVLALVGTAKPNECPDFQWDGTQGIGAEIAERIPAFVDEFGGHGVIGDVCAASYEPFFDEVVSVIEEACDDFVPPE